MSTVSKILQTKNVNILYEDIHILAIEKPSGLLILPDRYNPVMENLREILMKFYEQFFIVHRIDRETSGLVVFAKTAEAHSALNEQFANRRIKKSYLAIVNGAPDKDNGRIDLPISVGREKPKRMIIDRKEGKRSITDYTVLERFRGFSLIEARPQTGRQHQIRIHFKAVQMPILCDTLYGGGEGFYLSSLKSGYKGIENERPLLNRLALHSHSLKFEHPITKSVMEFKSELPKDMSTVLKVLRKYSTILYP